MGNLAVSRAARWYWLAFASFAGAVVAAAWAIATSRWFGRGPDVLAPAIAADLAVVVPAAYWWLVVRRGLAPWRTLVPVIVVLLLAARAILPAGQRAIVDWARFLVAPAEIALVAYVSSASARW